MPLLFAYGTLRKEGVYHSLIEPCILSSEKAWTRGAMYHYDQNGLGIGYYPYLTHGSRVIHGELFTFTDEKQGLSIADDLEENGLVYDRILHPTYDTRNHRHKAWVYFIKNPPKIRGKEVVSGDWILEVETW